MTFILNNSMDWTLHFEKQAKSGFGSPIHYETHFKHQIGGGGFYVGAKYQKGYGLGGLLAKIGRMVLPILKPVAKSLGKQIIKSGAQFAGDVIDGKNVKEAFQQNVSQGVKELGKNVIQPKRGVKRKRKVANNVISKRRRSRQQDIFD